MIDVPHRWLAVPEAARILRISDDVIYDMAKTGFLDEAKTIPVLKIGRQYRIPAGALDGMIDDGGDA